MTSSLADALEGAAIVFMAVPSHGFRAVLNDMRPLAGGIEAVVSLAKGIEMGTNLRMSQVVAEVLPGVPAGVLTGPNLAREVAEGHPAACVVALRDEALRAACRGSCTRGRSVPTWVPTSSGARSPVPRRTSWPSRPASVTGWASGTTPGPS